MDEDLGNLIRRLRRFGERWPHEEPTAEMCREAADELERLRHEVEQSQAENERLGAEVDRLYRKQEED